MNTRRVLRTSNVLLMLMGYQMHWFDTRLQRYRISVPGVLNVFVLACIYAGCFSEHFQPAAVLKTLLDVSPFLYGLMRLHLLLSVKVFSYAVYASVHVVGVAGTLTESLPIKFATTRKASLKHEIVAYCLLFSTFVVLLSFGFYIAYEMEFKLPPMQSIMIGFALFLPHLVLAGALRFYCLFAWLIKVRLLQLESEAEELLSESKTKTELQLVADSSSVAVTATTLSTEESLLQQLQQLAINFGNFFDHLQRSLLLLLGINANCLLFGIYAYVYYSKTWHVLFEDRKQRIFYAGNISIYACIACDYACLLLAQTFLEQQRSQFFDKLNSALSKRDSMPKRLRRIFKDMRNTLENSFKFKFLSIWRFDVGNFALMQILQLLIIALIVNYNFLNDAILQTNERFDSNDEDK